MVRIRRWVIGKRKKVVWSEPQLPPFVKINPENPPGANEQGLQPGDIPMPPATEEFRNLDEGEGEPVWVSPGPVRASRVPSCPRPGSPSRALMASSASRMFSTELA